MVVGLEHKVGRKIRNLTLRSVSRSDEATMYCHLGWRQA